MKEDARRYSPYARDVWHDFLFIDCLLNVETAKLRDFQWAVSKHSECFYRWAVELRVYPRIPSPAGIVTASWFLSARASVWKMRAMRREMEEKDASHPWSHLLTYRRARPRTRGRLRDNRSTTTSSRSICKLSAARAVRRG